jgi:hypothetical protein
LLEVIGQGKRVDELVTAMDRAAEAAVPEARDQLVSSVREMGVDDALKLVHGGDTAVTEFFARKKRTPLTEWFLPIVTRSTEKLALANKYNAVAGTASGIRLIKKEDADIQRYVTPKALDRLYLMIGEEGKKIPRDPIGTGSAIVEQVFGGLK